jgi:hypothetical protein
MAMAAAQSRRVMPAATAQRRSRGLLSNRHYGMMQDRVGLGGVVAAHAQREGRDVQTHRRPDRARRRERDLHACIAGGGIGGGHGGAFAYRRGLSLRLDAAGRGRATSEVATQRSRSSNRLGQQLSEAMHQARFTLTGCHRAASERR